MLEDMTKALTPEELLAKVRSQPESVEFDEVIATIEAAYRFTPTEFSNGVVANEVGTNEGSCKILGFAKLNSLTEPETLALFGTYYRQDVLENPQGDDHGNIRNFMITGWSGVSFDQDPLHLPG